MSAAPRPTGLVVSPVSTARVSDQIAERLTGAIRDGTLKPGDRLPTEAELARDFQVGRTSIREALQKLRALGLVESRKGLGAFVTEPAATDDPLADFARWTASDPAAIEQLVEARVALETLAAALAAIRATDREVDELERLHVAHANAADDTAALVSTDQAFHLALIRAARNRFVQRAYEVLIAELTDFRRKTLALPWAGERSVRGHAAILRAVRGHEPALARDAMAEHLWVLYSEIEESAAAEGRPLSLPLLPRDAIS
jgi:GntR family transcriptional repressor for pyruvate dehydrogenase complex